MTIGVLAQQGDFNAHLPVLGIATFVDLCIPMSAVILPKGRPRLEDVASGYWTPSIKRSSGLVSRRSLGYARDFGSRLRRRENASSSTPSSSADPSTFLTEFAILYLIDGVPTGICEAPGDYRSFCFWSGSFCGENRYETPGLSAPVEMTVGGMATIVE